MVESSTALAPFVKSIFHPSDFSKASELAFARALAIALIRRTELVIMHAGRESIGDWARFPPVRKTLERWQVLAPGSRRSAVFDRLTMRVTKVSPRGDPVEASMTQIASKNRIWSCSPHAANTACRFGSSLPFRKRLPAEPRR
jgi:hypothetical protein